MLKIITDRSDNGNTFLCETCVHGKFRSGTMSERVLDCGADYGGGRITFKVTQCDQHFHKSLGALSYNSTQMKTIKAQAMYYDVHRTWDGQDNPTYRKFIPFDEAKEKHLV